MKTVFILIFILFTGLLCFCFGWISLPVSITLRGWIRPIHERTNILSLTGGIIDSIFFQEGQLVKAGSEIARIKDFDRTNQLALLEYEIAWRKNYVQDLQTLRTDTSAQMPSLNIRHPALRQQYSRFVHSVDELGFSLNKAKKELDIASHLAKEKVIAPKELYDKETEFNRLSAARMAFLNEQLILWEQELDLKRQELKQFESQRTQLLENQYLYKIKAPVDGILQDIPALYKGSAIQAGQIIGTVSPETELIAECFAGPSQVGLLKLGQEVRFQIDAFDYKFFGILLGKITSIDNDYTLADQKPVYKIKCSFEKTQLLLKNGYTGNLKKGMSFSARFIITERTLWQLLWDNLDDWLKPVY